MKKVILDVNVLKKEKIEKIIKSNVINKLNNTLELYISEVCLKQRLPFLFKAKHFEEYDYYVDFIKKYCNENIIDAASEVISKEIRSDFRWTRIYSTYTTEGLYYHNDPNNKIDKFDIEESHSLKINTMKNFQMFVNEFKTDVYKIYNIIDWKHYCYNFIDKYNFAISEMNIFLQEQQLFNKNTFVDLLKFWWECTTVASTLHYFHLSNLSLNKFRKIINYEIPRNSFAYRKLKADYFLIDYCLLQGRKVDQDTPNDTTYIAHMNNFDILLTDDGKSHEKFMKACFKYVYSDEKNKEILNLDEFINRFS